MVSYLETSSQCVDDHTEGNEEGRKVDVEAGEGVDDGGATEQQHGSDDDVGEEAEAQEDDVSRLAPSGRRREGVEKRQGKGSQV